MHNKLEIYIIFFIFTIFRKNKLDINNIIDEKIFIEYVFVKNVSLYIFLLYYSLLRLL